MTQLIWGIKVGFVSVQLFYTDDLAVTVHRKGNYSFGEKNRAMRELPLLFSNIGTSGAGPKSATPCKLYNLTVMALPFQKAPHLTQLVAFHCHIQNRPG